MNKKSQNTKSFLTQDFSINDIVQNPIFKKILDKLPYAIGIFDKDYNILFLNKNGYHFLGLSENKNLKMKCFEQFGKTSPCNDCSEAIFLKKAFLQQQTYLPETSQNIFTKSYFIYDSSEQLEYIINYIRFFKHDKSIFPQENLPANLELLLAERIEDLMASNQKLQSEVMERICIENELKESQIIFNSLIETIPEIVYLKDLNGKNLVSNKAFEKFVGLQKAEIIGKTDKELFPTSLAEIFVQSDNDIIKNKKSIHIIADFIDPAGNKKYLESIKTPILDLNNNVEGIVGLSRDITEQKIAEETLKISRNELAQTYDYIHNLMELSPIATLSLDSELMISTINQKALDVLGYVFDELIGVSFINLLVKPEKFVKGSSKPVILEFTTKEGTSLIANVSQSVINKTGMDERIVVTFQNISDLRGLFVDPLQEESLENEAAFEDFEDKYVKLDPGCIYFVDDTDTEDSYRMFSNMVKSGVPGLCITRQNPTRVRNTYSLLKTPFIWLTKNQSSDQPFIDSSELYKLQPTIYNFIDKVNLGVVFLDGLEYLSLDNDIKSVIKAIEEVNDSVMNSNSSMIIHINSLALDLKEFHLMTRWMKPVKCL
ncbi:DUF835 domain-containing protein [Methanolobus psychrotolerans]|uniref:DUF835 domain-containing protein n=1 Tax=Methanolobus psychrotolerans TaxID=1874706 RepID=UPI000B91BBAA|nr:DUF835 domain-containing protein [Methanolobus psychrotolerans]